MKLAIIIIIGCLVAAPVGAWYVDHIVPCTDDCTICHAWQLASNIINFITFNLALTIAPLLFVAAGILYVTSGGSETRVKKAQSIFTNAVIGLVIIFCAWLLVDTALKTLAGGRQTGENEIIWSWNKFPECRTGTTGGW